MLCRKVNLGFAQCLGEIVVNIQSAVHNDDVACHQDRLRQERIECLLLVVFDANGIPFFVVADYGQQLEPLGFDAALGNGSCGGFTERPDYA